VTEAPAPKQRAVRVKEITMPDGRTGWEYSDGSVRDAHGYMLKSLPGKRFITVDNARELLARRRLIGLRAQLRGLAKAEGVDPSEIDDELLMQAGSALEALTLHMASTFKKSSSLRGMAEVYGVLASPLVGDRRQKEEDSPANEQPQIVNLIYQFFQAASAPTLPAGDVVEGEIKD
jgi:hypothetical protein